MVRTLADVCSLPRVRTPARLLLIAIALAACEPGGNPSPSPTPLASDQTLSFPITQDLADFDPALISSPADVDILRNVFSGLYRFDDQLHEVPDLADGQPAISADGLEYTFKLRAGARFSNGDPITATDVQYSWNRAARRQGDYASLFSLIAGYPAVASGRAAAMSGLSVIDAQRLQVTLLKPASYFLTEVTLWPFWVVDRNVISSAGEDSWVNQASTLIGSGPFRMSARTPGQSIDFEPVPDWYGGKTGALKHVHVQVLADQATQVNHYESGVFSLIGYGRQSLPSAQATRYAADPKLSKELALVPLGVTYWVGFNIKTGLFAGVDGGRAARHAFSQAVDRKALEQAVCNLKTSCVEATGGVISKGLAGYLGDAADHNVKFDAQAAKTEYQSWDPTGVKVKGLAYVYDSDPFNKAVCANLRLQWKNNLGVDVACRELDRKTFFDQRNTRCAYPLFRQSWAADYDHPQNWFDYLFVSGAPSSGSCYSNPAFDSAIGGADRAAPASPLAPYLEAGQTLVNDSIIGALLYGVQQYLVQPYVIGAGGNALYDNDWRSVRILAH
jgi:oligopeptide transport system substrate-binding protein